MCPPKLVTYPEDGPIIHYRGVTKTVDEWSQISGVATKSILARLKRFDDVHACIFYGLRERAKLAKCKRKVAEKDLEEQWEPKITALCAPWDVMALRSPANGQWYYPLNNLTGFN